MSVRAPAEKNFRRAKVRPGGKKGGAGGRAARWLPWRIGRWGVTLVVLLYAGYRGTNLVLQASGLQIRRITVHGNVRLSSGEVRAIVDGLRGSNILTVDLPGYRRRLMQSPWVADAGLRRVLPATVEVFVSERRPMGLCRLGSALYLVDPHGTLIDEFGPQYAEFDLPIIDGLAAAPRDSATLVDPARAALAARVLAALQARPDLARRVSQIDVSDDRDATLLLKGDTALVRVGTEQFVERLQSYLDLAPALRERIAAIDSVDLRFDQRVYVRPAAKRGN